MNGRQQNVQCVFQFQVLVRDPVDITLFLPRNTDHPELIPFWTLLLQKAFFHTVESVSKDRREIVGCMISSFTDTQQIEGAFVL